MKKILLISSFILLCISCSVDDAANDPSFTWEFVPAQSVELPVEFTRGETYEIKVNYITPTNCYSFDSFFFEEEGNQTTVVINNLVLLNQICEPSNGQISQDSFEYKVGDRDSYIFRFWKGKDFNDEDDFIVVEVPVSR